MTSIFDPSARQVRSIVERLARGDPTLTPLDLDLNFERDGQRRLRVENSALGKGKGEGQALAMAREMPSHFDTTIAVQVAESGRPGRAELLANKAHTEPALRCRPFAYRLVFFLPLWKVAAFWENPEICWYY